MAPQTRPIRLLLLLGAVLAAALWCLRPERSGAPDAEGSTAFARASAPAEVPAAAPALSRAASPRKVLRCEDALTGEALDLEIRIREGGEERARLRAGAWADLSALPPESIVSYAVGAAELEHGLPLSACLRPSAEHWLLALPYSCQIEVELRGAQPAAGERGQIMLCPDPRGLPEPQAPDGEQGPYTLAGLDMSLEGLLHWRLRSGSLKAACKAGFTAAEPAPVRIAASGDFLLSLIFRGGASAVAPVRLEPGAILRVPLELRERPALRGRLLDWNGQPVPREKVVLTVALDLADYDLRPGDPHGLMVHRQEGVLTHAVKKTYVTAEDGSFELSVPRGKEYAVYSYALGGYAFWSTLNGDGAPAAEMEAELRLAEPSAANCVAITVLQPDGRPLSAASIEIGVAGDLPFFRQWPAGLALDEAGSVTVPGMEPGMRVGVVIRHESLERGLYAPAYPTVTSDRRIEVRLPELALNSGSR